MQKDITGDDYGTCELLSCIIWQYTKGKHGLFLFSSHIKHCKKNICLFVFFLILWNYGSILIIICVCVFKHFSITCTVSGRKWRNGKYYDHILQQNLNFITEMDGQFSPNHWNIILVYATEICRHLLIVLVFR